MRLSVADRQLQPPEGQERSPEDIVRWERPTSPDSGEPRRFASWDEAVPGADLTIRIERVMMCVNCRCCSLGRTSGDCVGGCTKEKSHPPVTVRQRLEAMCRCRWSSDHGRPHESTCYLYEDGPREPDEDEVRLSERHAMGLARFYDEPPIGEIG
jgi:hypothetical protein